MPFFFILPDVASAVGYEDEYPLDEVKPASGSDYIVPGYASFKAE